MADAQYEEGKVYLRDVRSGQIYLFERHLESNKNFEACVPNPVKGEASDETPAKDDSDKDPEVQQ